MKLPVHITVEYFMTFPGFVVMFVLFPAAGMFLKNFTV